jgi:Spy/CpxP family protein refolding chaperone
MKMTKTIALAVLVAGSLLAGTALQAQDAPKEKPAMHGRPNADQIAKDLNLTDDQKTKVKAALKDQQTKMKALHDDKTLSKEDRRAKSKEIREATQAKMKEILTPEQLEKWQKMQHNHQRGGAKPAAGSETTK